MIDSDLENTDASRQILKNFARHLVVPGRYVDNKSVPFGMIAYRGKIGSEKRFTPADRQLKDSPLREHIYNTQCILCVKLTRES